MSNYRGENSLSTIRKSAVNVGSKTAEKRGEVTGVKKKMKNAERRDMEELYLQIIHVQACKLEEENEGSEINDSEEHLEDM